MFDQYLLPVKTAAMVFPVLAVVLLVPFSFVAYRRRGRLGWLRSLVFFGFAYFAVAAFLLTLMPLPRDPARVCATFPAAAHPQYVPGNFLVDFVKESHGRHGIAVFVGNPSLYQVAFNAVMLAPLGIFLRYYAGRSLAVTAAAGLGTSLLLELTQGTGVWGLYPCPYRLADVDDLLLNTTGAVLGWLWAGRALALLPDLVARDEAARRSTEVVFGRRLWALAFDAVASATVALVVTLAWLFAFGRTDSVAVAVPLATATLWFVVLPRLTGATPGKRLMRLTLIGRHGRAPGWTALFVRHLIVLVFALAGGAVLIGTESVRTSELLMFGLTVPAAVVSGLVVLVRRDNRGPHELVSGVSNAVRGDRRRPAPRHRRDWSRAVVSTGRPSGHDV